MIRELQKEINVDPGSRYEYKVHGGLMVAKEMSYYTIPELLGHVPRKVESLPPCSPKLNPIGMGIKGHEKWENTQ